MNLDGITIGQLKELAAMFGRAESVAPASKHVGKKCIIRTYASGVHFGTLTANSGRTVELSNARRLWRWDAKNSGISLSEVANHGGADGRHKFCEVVSEMTILDALEIIPCTADAATIIESQPVAKP